MDHILSIVLFAPLVGMAILLCIPSSNARAIKWWANIASFIGFLISLPLVFNFDHTRDYQFVERADWIPTLGAHYHLGIDGFGLLLVMLTTLLGFISILSSWNAINTRLKEYYSFFLLLQTAMLGVFMSLDFLLFFVFWESVLVPMYFIIAIWGGPRRSYAAIKFMIYTLIGSVLMLLGILTLYFMHYSQFQVYSFEIADLMRTQLSSNVQWWVFWAFFVGFAVKVPMFPFHTWLPDAHVEAPTGGLLFGEPPGFLHARHFRAQPRGHFRFHHPADQPRNFHRHALPGGGYRVRTAPHPRDFRIRRPAENHADLHSGLRHRGSEFHGDAAAQRLHRRDRDFAGRVPDVCQLGLLGMRGNRAGRGLPAVAFPADHARRRERKEQLAERSLLA